MFRSPSRRAFTLIEMITVIAIIAILTSLVLGVNGLVQSKSARARTETEIRMLSSACESYKNDNGGYPQTAETDAVNPRSDFIPTGPSYRSASLALYKALSGDANANGQIDTASTPPETNKNYAPDFFKPSRLGGIKVNGVVTAVQYIQDPFGNSYGYSTAGLAAEQTYTMNVAKAATPAAARAVVRTTAGYNPTFDLWSTAGQSSSTGVAKWVKNW